MVAARLHVRPRDALLPPARARLGRRRLGTEGRPEGNLGAGQSISSWLKSSPATSPTRRKAAPVRRAGPAGHLRRRVLGPPEYKAAARGQPDGRGALPRALAATRCREAARHLRREEPHPNFLVGGAASPISAGPAAAPRPPRSTWSRWASCARSSSPCRPSSTVSTCPTRWPSPASTRTGCARRGPGQLPHRGRLSGAGGGDAATGLIPSGVILGRDLKAIQPFDLRDPAQVQEVRGALWYRHSSGAGRGRCTTR